MPFFKCTTLLWCGEQVLVKKQHQFRSLCSYATKKKDVCGYCENLFLATCTSWQKTNMQSIMLRDGYHVQLIKKKERNILRKRRVQSKTIHTEFNQQIKLVHLGRKKLEMEICEDAFKRSESRTYYGTWQAVAFYDQRWT